MSPGRTALLALLRDFTSPFAACVHHRCDTCDTDGSWECAYCERTIRSSVDIDDTRPVRELGHTEHCLVLRARRVLDEEQAKGTPQ